MIIVIDGYNLLKQIFPGKGNSLDSHRTYFIKQLACYKKHKNAAIGDIIVVFDAGPHTHAQRQIKYGVAVVFSGTRQSADDWILDYLNRSSNPTNILVVTLDRALREACARKGADWLSVHDFYSILQQVLLEAAYTTLPEAHGSDIVQYEPIELDDETENLIDQRETDRLMAEAARYKTPVKDDASQAQGRKGSAHETSKKDKRLTAKIKKLH